MERGARRGPKTPRGVALTGQVPPPRHGEGMAGAPGGGPVPQAATEKPSCHGEPPGTTSEAEAAAVPPEEVGEGLGDSSPQTPPVPAWMPTEQPAPRGSCLIRNWQEERATNDLDRVLRPELGSEGFFYRHGHRELLAHQLLSQLADSTTTKDAYRQPWRTALPARGQREAMLEFMLYQKYRKEMLEEICPPPGPMELVSTTHRDYCAEGFQPMPLPATQPHDCYTEQPCTYWLEQAHGVPGVTSICTTDTPFRRNAAFSTPVTEQRGQPLP
ncbi:sperm-associated antigen 8 isoform X2 [Dromaius novaehollandiae]|uniref:sperm-associated antigen 8 isoform X2 n=1 Tax=Dromaius novaehollandiae TaxID=8790 RepID=UPI00311D6068